MAEGRMLRRKIALDKRLAQLSSDRSRLFFTWCIPFLDVEGRMTGDPEVVKAMVFPLLKSFTAKTIEQDIADCADFGLVRAYAVHGERYLYFPGFNKNQQLRRDREAASVIPPPPGQAAAGVGDDERGSTRGALPELSGTTPPQVKLREEKLSTCTREGDFEIFWSLYPRKRSRTEALKAWGKLSPTVWEATVMMAAVALAAETEDWQRDGGQYIPHASTWLRGRRWEDHLAPTANGSRPSARNGAGSSSPPLVDLAAKLRDQEAAAQRLKEPPHGASR